MFGFVRRRFWVESMGAASVAVLALVARAEWRRAAVAAR